MLKQLTKAQCHDRNARVLNPVGSARKSKKTLKGELPIEIPRDRQGAFEPQLIFQTPNPPDWIRRQDSAALRARHTVCEIQSQLDEMRGAEASVLPISSLTDVAIEAVKARQSRPLHALSRAVYRHCLPVKAGAAGAVGG